MFDANVLGHSPKGVEAAWAAIQAAGGRRVQALVPLVRTYGSGLREAACCHAL